MIRCIIMGMGVRLDWACMGLDSGVRRRHFGEFVIRVIKLVSSLFHSGEMVVLILGFFIMKGRNICLVVK